MLVELNKIRNWIVSNKLKLNVLETYYILFQKRSVKINVPHLLLNNKYIKQVSGTKFLGVWIDENLNFRYHIDGLC